MGTRKIYVEQVQFPATQVASSDANCLDDYEEGTWTPAVTFATPGDLSVAYTTQSGWYTKVGNVVCVWWNLLTSSFTHTTASGSLQLSGLPFAAAANSGSFNFGTLSWQGITKASYTQVAPRLVNSAQALDFIASGSAQAVSTVAFGDVPTAGTVLLRGQLTYRV